METIAIYWEEKIRIYGVTIKGGLALFKITYLTTDSEFWSDELENFSTISPRFFHITGQLIADNLFQTCLLVETKDAKELRLLLESSIYERVNCRYEVVSNVELVSLHGPHFQDRYGIADVSYSLLTKHSVELFVSSFTGTSINLVVADSMGHKTKEILSETFIVP